MQYKVPQNVDIEDRVIGPLSLRQFTIVLVGLGITVFLYVILQGFLRPLFWFLALIIVPGSFGIAMAKYGSQNFEEFLLSVFQTLSKPRQRVWKKHEETTPQNIKKETKLNTKKTDAKKKSLIEAHDDLSRLAELVDSGGNIPMAEKDRIISFVTNIPNPETAPDLLGSNETKESSLEKFLEKAEKDAPKREPLISEQAKVSPSKEFKYDEIQRI